MKWRQLLFQYFDHLPAYARGSVDTWRSMLERFYQYGFNNRARLLEIGCGYAYPYVALFHSINVQIVGIDIQPLVNRNFNLARYFSRWRTQGFLPTARRLVSDFLFQLAFYYPLGRRAKVSIKRAGMPIMKMDASRMAFEDATFDFVFSSACFEHLESVEAVLNELARVLRPGGLAEIEIHLFTSMTGGHEPELYDHRKPPDGFKLWRHLSDPTWGAPVFLNRWREHQFREIFDRHFEIVSRSVTSNHGHQYLTPDIVSRLTPEYSVDELVNESVLYVLRNRQLSA